MIILRDFNIGNVVAFIDNVLVVIDSKIEYNELVEEILKRITYILLWQPLTKIVNSTLSSFI